MFLAGYKYNNLQSGDKQSRSNIDAHEFFNEDLFLVAEIKEQSER